MKSLKIRAAITVLCMGIFSLSLCAVPTISAAGTLEIESLPVMVQDIDMGDYQTEMVIGQTQLLRVTVLPIDVADQEVTYRSDNTNIAAINMMGRITAINAGETKISASAGGVTRDFTLKVTAEQVGASYIAVNDIEISNFKDIIRVDETVDLTALVLPKDATKQEISYSSSNMDVATVNLSGQIKGIAPGNTIITAEADGFKKSIDLTVKVATQNIETNTAYLVLNESDEFRLYAKVLPDNADQIITYKSLSPNVADVSENGLIKAISHGSCSILISAWDTSKIVNVIVSGNSGEESQGDDVQVFNPSETNPSELVRKIAELPEKGELSIEGELFSNITSDVLKELYGTGKSLIIRYSDYNMTILGADIKNADNELNTKISFAETSQGFEFSMNDGKNLPGRIKIQVLDKQDYSYLYLYSEVKGAYQKISTLENGNTLFVDSCGKYILTHSKISAGFFNRIIFVIIAVLVTGSLIAYIAAKKRHWFW